MLPLNAQTLTEHAKRVPTPTYDRSQVRTGIVHFGVGRFHRAHQAMYVDQLLREGQGLDWGICGVGVLASDRPKQQALQAQDGLYTLVAKHADGTYEPRVIGSLVQYLFAPDDPERVIEKMAEPQVRIVSLTITEGGYNIDSVTGEFHQDNPEVLRDLEPGAVPHTAFGLLTEALVRRRARSGAPFTVMSCDNIQGNGDVARRSFSAFAALRDAELGEWVRHEVHFPNCMVDRITPVTTDADRTEITRRFGIEDRCPVVCEPFAQWVLEDDFSLGRPPLEDAGVQLLTDVEPYELMKLRLLNASHQGLCYFGYLAGYRLVHEVAQDPLFASFLLAYMDREAAPTLGPVPGVDLHHYQHLLIERFSNAEVRDTVARLCAESSDRIPKWLLPVLRHNLASGGEIERSVAIVASWARWARYAEGVDERGEPIQVVDRLREPLMAAAHRWQNAPLAFVATRDVFGDLVDDQRFVTVYTAVLASLHDKGARATLQDLTTRG